MAVTEQNLLNLAQAVRSELASQIEALRQELSVEIAESHGRTAGLSADEVRALIGEVAGGADQLTIEDVRREVEEHSEPGLTIEQVRDEIARNATPGVSMAEVRTEVEDAKASALTVEELKGDYLRLRVFADELADRVGAPRLEG